MACLGGTLRASIVWKRQEMTGLFLCLLPSFSYLLSLVTLLDEISSEIMLAMYLGVFMFLLRKRLYPRNRALDWGAQGRRGNLLQKLGGSL